MSVSPHRLPALTSMRANPAVPPQTSQQVVCYDTSERFFLQHDSIVFYSYDNVHSADGNLLISGEYIKWDGYYLDSKGFVMKTDYKGNILWLHAYDTLPNHSNHHYISYYKMSELKDGSILLAGVTNSYDPTLNEPVILTKIDAAGNIIWSKNYKSGIWLNGDGSADYYYIQEMKEDPQNSDIYISGAFWGGGQGIKKIDGATGNLIWSRMYEVYSNGYGTFESPFGLDIRENEIRLFGSFLLFNNSVITVYRLKKTNGDTLQTKFLLVNDPLASKVGFLDREKLTILANGNYALSGSCYGLVQYPADPTKPFYQAAVAELDTNLNFVRAYAFKNYIQSNMYNTKVTVYPDGSSIFSMLHYITGYNTDVFYVQTRNAQIIKQRKIEYRGQGAPNESNAIRLADGSDLIARMIADSISNKGRIEYLKLHPSDTSSTCLGIDDVSTSVYNFTYAPVNYYQLNTRVDVFYESRSKSIMTEAYEMDKQQSCFRTSYCDSLKLVSPATTICLSQSLQITVRKNKACGMHVPLTVDTSVIRSMNFVNDSTVTIQFSKPWSGYIYGILPGCTLLYDSIFINVLQIPDTLNLGPDKAICPGNRIFVNAGKGYNTYLWQDGSTDSTYTITAPGWYFVTTTDACGGIYLDSIMVTATPPIDFDAGPDRTKCNQDTLHLTAPAGFMNYTWHNSYNINVTTGQTVVVNPEVDTAYYVQAEKTPGCFAYDTIRVSVNHSPPINLGIDKSICSGDSLVLNAGNGFQHWLWSNDSTTREIIIKNAGQYSVIGSTLNSCKSYDTVNVLNVYPLPVVELDQEPGMCTGSARILDAGNFNTYQWSTGANTRTITIRDTGVYTVNVTSTEGCKGSGATSITTLHPLPADFLPNDTAMCTYSRLEIGTTLQFNRYVWNTGGAGPSIRISMPGLYWMEVTDANNCKGKDTILITSKDCLKGFYIPTAFTPNDDYQNDVFKPLLFGNVENFSFTIFNRWGQAIFRTTELQKGWDGKIGGLPQQTGVYAWVCIYRLEGEPQKTEKGTVTLIR